MSQWTFAQSQPSDDLAQLHFFTMKKPLLGGASRESAEFVITVHEYATPREESMRFFAQADKQTNQKTAPFTPTGWGNTLLKALSECVRAVHRFPYEGPA